MTQNAQPTPAKKGEQKTGATDKNRKDTPKDLPTPDRVAVKQAKEDEPIEDSIADDPGAFKLPGDQFYKGQKLDTETMSDQPGAKR